MPQIEVGLALQAAFHVSTCQLQFRACNSSTGSIFHDTLQWPRSTCVCACISLGVIGEIIFQKKVVNRRRSITSSRFHPHRMGCGSSKSAVAPQQTIWKSPQGRERSTSRPNSGLMCQNGGVTLEKEAHHHTTITAVQEATENTEKATESTRIISASSTDSKISMHTNDSGVGDDYAQMIPERPTTEEKETATEAPNLTIDGSKIATPAPVSHSLPAGHRSHPLPPILTSANDAKIPDSPSTTSPYGWAAFDIIMGERPEGGVNRKRKPPGVRRLERRRGENTSKEELLEKQRVAEQRRKVS